MSVSKCTFVQFSFVLHGFLFGSTGLRGIGWEAGDFRAAGPVVSPVLPALLPLPGHLLAPRSPSCRPLSGAPRAQLVQGPGMPSPRHPRAPGLWTDTRRAHVLPPTGPQMPVPARVHAGLSGQELYTEDHKANDVI